MKFTAILISFLLFSISAYAETISVSKDQFKNLGEVDKALRTKYAQFKGFNGPADKLEVIGLPAQAAREQMSKMDFTALESEKIEALDEESMVQNRIRKLAIDSLKSEGIKFKYIEEGV